jgi:hypothetical protein
MKKIALFSFAFVALSIASCKKTRTCTCSGTTTTVTTTIDPSGNVTDTQTSSSPESYTNQLSNTTKKAAKGTSECMTRTEKFSDNSILAGVTTKNDYTSDITCTLN